MPILATLLRVTIVKTLLGDLGIPITEHQAAPRWAAFPMLT